MMDTTNMTESELTDYYDRTGDLSEFEVRLGTPGDHRTHNS
jgi:hypothetical protein